MGCKNKGMLKNYFKKIVTLSTVYITLGFVSFAAAENLLSLHTPEPSLGWRKYTGFINTKIVFESENKNFIIKTYQDFSGQCAVRITFNDESFASSVEIYKANTIYKYKIESNGQIASEAAHSNKSKDAFSKNITIKIENRQYHKRELPSSDEALSEIYQTRHYQISDLHFFDSDLSNLQAITAGELDLSQKIFYSTANSKWKKYYHCENLKLVD
jgi:hypothetical protein